MLLNIIKWVGCVFAGIFLFLLVGAILSGSFDGHLIPVF